MKITSLLLGLAVLGASVSEAKIPAEILAKIQKEIGRPVVVGQREGDQPPDYLKPIRQAKVKVSIRKRTLEVVGDGEFKSTQEDVCVKEGLIDVFDMTSGPKSIKLDPSFSCESKLNGKKIELYFVGAIWLTRMEGHIHEGLINLKGFMSFLYPVGDLQVPNWQAVLGQGIAWGSRDFNAKYGTGIGWTSQSGVCSITDEPGPKAMGKKECKVDYPEVFQTFVDFED